jgi:hypothetical protein
MWMCRWSSGATRICEILSYQSTSSNTYLLWPVSMRPIGTIGPLATWRRSADVHPRPFANSWPSTASCSRETFSPGQLRKLGNVELIQASRIPISLLSAVPVGAIATCQAQFSKAALSSVQLPLSARSADPSSFDSRLHRESQSAAASEGRKNFSQSFIESRRCFLAKMVLRPPRPRVLTF